MGMNPTRFLLMVAAVLMMVGCERRDETPPSAAATETRVYSVTGMHCDACAKSITGALAKLEGVRSAEVSFEKKQAVVQCAAQVADATVVAAITGLGYQAERVGQQTQ